MSQALRNKIIFFLSFGAMVAVLFSIAYMSFLRKIEVDVMDGMKLVYSGENGSASVEADKSGNNINQREQAFLDTVEYQIEPSSGLKNGDIIHVKASYDHEIADQYNFDPVNTEMEVRVEGLVDKYNQLADIDEKYLENILKEADQYVDNRETDIFRIEVEDKAKKPRLEDNQTVYQAFLKAKDVGTDDRILEIKRLMYKYKEKDYVLYFSVVVPQINQSNEVMDQDIYGEKANLTNEELEAQDYNGYVTRIYQNRFDIQPMITQQEETENPE